MICYFRSPIYTGDMLQRASRLAEKFGWIDECALSRALNFITSGKTPLGSEGKVLWPKIGDDANFVFTNASCSAEAVARISKRKATMYKGKLVYGEL